MYHFATVVDSRIAGGSDPKRALALIVTIRYRTILYRGLLRETRGNPNRVGWRRCASREKATSFFINLNTLPYLVKDRVLVVNRIAPVAEQQHLP